MTVDSEPAMSRLALSRRVCQWLDWRRNNGAWKDMSCRVALLKLQQRGKLQLPLAGARPPARLKSKKPFSGKRDPIQCNLSKLMPVKVMKVDRGGTQASRLWNDMMDECHYLGAGPLCGGQIRYLIQGAQGQWLGGLAFSAGAWHIDVRDKWIGWNLWAHQHNLEKVICNSRFLILPWVKVPNLASYVLSLCRKRLVSDWREQYGVEPVLMETYIDSKRFLGTCYRAANWVHAGTSLGRGRQDRNRAFAQGKKEVYLYPLNRKARKILCVEPPKPVQPIHQVAGKQDWANEEFGLIKFKDHRLNQRLLIVARDLYERPQANIPQACQSRSKTKAAYRFFDNTETSMEKILTSHYESTLRRVNQEKVVLLVQDTTSLNYSAHPSTMDMGPINTTVDGAMGLEVHDTMAFTLEGTPLGLADVQCWARDPKKAGKKQQRRDLPIQDKESYKWLASFEKVIEAQKRCPKTMLVSVGDREADIYELFLLALRDASGPKLLVRAMQNRLLAQEGGYLWKELAHKPMGGIQVISVPRQGQRAARKAQMEVRFAQVKLRPPKGKTLLGELNIWAVLAQEVHVPEGVEPLKWMLLSTLEVNTYEQAVEKLLWYAKRWGIEVYHRTLKSGCKVEERQLGTADRIETCLAIDMVVAWRIFHLTKLGRETPNVPCSVYFEEAEWKALYSFVRQDPNPPQTPPTLHEAIRMVASLGGFLGRKGDGEPGTKSLWLGLQRLDDIAETWEFVIKKFAPHLLSSHCPVSSNPGYG